MDTPTINLKMKIDNQNNWAIATSPKILNYLDRLKQFHNRYQQATENKIEFQTQLYLEISGSMIGFFLLTHTHLASVRTLKLLTKVLTI